MAVPKTKVSKSKRNKRNSSNFKAVAPTLSTCPSCHEIKVSHKVCKKCGFYDGKKVVEVEKQKKQN